MTGSGKPSNKATRHSPGNKRRNGQGLPPRKRFLHVRGSRKGKAGPRYPSILLKELKALPGNGKPEDDQDPGISTADVYEYEEGVPEEESGKNRRFDDVDRLEYELPSDFEVSLMATVQTDTTVHDLEICVSHSHHSSGVG